MLFFFVAAHCSSDIASDECYVKLSLCSFFTSNVRSMHCSWTKPKYYMLLEVFPGSALGVTLKLWQPQSYRDARSMPRVFKWYPKIYILTMMQHLKFTKALSIPLFVVLLVNRLVPLVAKFGNWPLGVTKIPKYPFSQIFILLCASQPCKRTFLCFCY